jgi:hypothetical protein
MTALPHERRDGYVQRDIVSVVAEPPDDDVVDPIDRKLHAILMRAAETLEDPQQRHQALELALTGRSQSSDW